jgi:hypothetical protein
LIIKRKRINNNLIINKKSRKMKKLMLKLVVFVVCVLITVSVSAQVKGNGKIITKQMDFEKFTEVDLSFVANVVITCQAENSFEITADENVLPFIGLKIEGNQLKITQDKWIEPSKKVAIKIGMKNLTRLNTSGYSSVTVNDLNEKELQVMPLVGKIVLNGKVEILRAGTEVGEIDATNLTTNKVFANVWSRGVLKINTTNTLHADVQKNGKIVYTTEPETVKKKVQSGGQVISKNGVSKQKKAKSELVYVKFDLKNNTALRKHFYVKGPNAHPFSYGFPINPLMKRAENWPVGTKVYRESKAGVLTVLYEVKASDEGKVIDLF